MNKRDLFALSLATAMNLASGQDAQAQESGSWKIWKERPPVVNSMVIPGNEKIGGPLNHLLHNGKPLGDTLKGQYTLVYFGTPYRLPTCASELLVINEAVKLLEQRFGADVAARVTPVFVYPPHDPQKQPAASNLSMFVNAKDSRFVGLTGTHQQVLDAAKGFRARYMDGDGAQGGVYTSHTRFTYLIGPDGKNLAIFPGDSLYVFIADQLALNLTRDGVIKPEAGKASPGMER